MGLSRNKVAVSEGAAGSPPFYGDPNRAKALFQHPRSVPDSDCPSIRCLILRALERGTFTKEEVEQKPSGQPYKYGGVAQLGEHLLCKQGVIGSIPFISTKARETETPLN